MIFVWLGVVMDKGVRDEMLLGSDSITRGWGRVGGRGSIVGRGGGGALTRLLQVSGESGQVTQGWFDGRAKGRDRGRRDRLRMIFWRLWSVSRLGAGGGIVIRGMGIRSSSGRIRQGLMGSREGSSIGSRFRPRRARDRFKLNSLVGFIEAPLVS